MPQKNESSSENKLPQKQTKQENQLKQAKKTQGEGPAAGVQQTALLTTASPHIFGKSTTARLMLIVVLAMLPTLAASVFIFGARVLLVTGVSVLACVLFEWLYNRITKKPQSINDFSAVVTGMILAFNMPSTISWWIPIVGAFAAIVVTKMLFGGIGYNFANPALVGRTVLMLSFSSQMISYTYPAVPAGGIDALASATPLVVAKMADINLLTLLFGRHGGVIGETCAITLLLGFGILVFTKVIKVTIPAVYVGSTFIFKLFIDILGTPAGFGSLAMGALRYVLSGGLLLGAIFMATDYTTSPYTTSGQVVYGLGLGLITVALREWARAPEGVSYALLIMALLVPFINVWCRKLPFGTQPTKINFLGKFSKGGAK